jgi:hypothetical protein
MLESIHRNSSLMISIINEPLDLAAASRRAKARFCRRA